MFRIPKNKQGYGYKYTDLSQIHKLLEENGLSYYQYVQRIGEDDYVMTVRIDAEGNEDKPLQGCRVVQATLSGKSNPAQEQGSALTYARRYSLLLAYGLATEDDDAAMLTDTTVKGKIQSTGIKTPPKRNEKFNKIINDQQFVNVTDALDDMGLTQTAIVNRFGVGSISEMTMMMYDEFMDGYHKWKEGQK